LFDGVSHAGQQRGSGVGAWRVSGGVEVGFIAGGGGHRGWCVVYDRLYVGSGGGLETGRASGDPVLRDGAGGVLGGDEIGGVGD
jgi:hypothetical protein